MLSPPFSSKVQKVYYQVAIIVLFPLFIQAGTITVNSPNDEDSPDDKITLREAILIAEGLREPADALDPSIDDETDEVSGPVGAEVADTIIVALPDGTIIQLGDHLPPLTDEGDSIDAGSLVTLQGQGITTERAAILIGANNYSVRGLTIQGFPSHGIEFQAENSSIGAMIIDGCQGVGLLMENVESNSVDNLVVKSNMMEGVRISGGSRFNTLHSLFSYGNAGNGITITGDETTSNTLYALSIGITEEDMYSGNTGWGIALLNGTNDNRIGNPFNFSQASQVAANELGGILLDNAEQNTIHSIGLGGFVGDDPWVGNGTGKDALVLQNGANSNRIGLPFANSVVAIGGQDGNAVTIKGLGSDNNSFHRLIVGRVELYSPALQPVKGHGVEIRGGVKGTKLGETPDPEERENTHVEINQCGGHGLFLNGDAPLSPLQNTLFEHYHAGDYVDQDNPVPFGGDAIRITGNVEGVVLGLIGHPNTTNGATNYGVFISGPNVRDVELKRIITLDRFGSGAPANGKGGVYIGDGAQNIRFNNTSDENRSFFVFDQGPAVTIDATGTPPQDVRIRNLTVGFDEFNIEYDYPANGIEILGPETGDPVELTDVRIGGFTALDNVLVTKCAENGLYIRGVKGVPLRNIQFGSNPDTTIFRGNSKDGLLVDRCEELDIGSTTTGGQNYFPFNEGAGVRFVNGSHSIAFQGNIVGLNRAGDNAMGNDIGIYIEDGPPAEKELIIGGKNQILGSTGFNSLFEGNIISGSRKAGILIGEMAAEERTPGSDIERVKLFGNMVGTDITGQIDFGNLNGIVLRGPRVKGVQIGDTIDDEKGNIVSGNDQSGIALIDSASGWELYRNYIGLKVGTIGDEPRELPNGKQGILLSDVTQGVIGKGTVPYAPNIISGNTEAGIRINGNTEGDIKIQHNYIGTSTTGALSVPNQDGIVIEPSVGTGSERLVIGGSSPALNSNPSGEPHEGNVISGNARDGIRVIAPGGQGDPSIVFVDIQGNYIGTPPDSLGRLGNGEAGIRVTGGAVIDTTIGSKSDPSKGNLISANKKDGIVVEDNASKVEIYNNIIGKRLVVNEELKNERHGILLSSGANDCIIEKNTISFNEENGILMTGSSTKNNSWKDNSIFQNGKEGIRIEDGGNSNIQPPELKTLPSDEPSATSIVISTGLPNADLEISVDPKVIGSGGYWGQGRNVAGSFKTDGTGQYTLSLNSLPSAGFITAIVTDGDKNSSAYSGIIDGFVVQVVKTDPELLVANKPSVARLFINTGYNINSSRVSGTLNFNGATLTPIQPYDVEKYRGYFDQQTDVFARLDSKNSLNFLIPDPPEGTQKLSAIITQGGHDRARIEADVTFQKTRTINLAWTPLVTPPANGGLPTESPDFKLMLKALSLCADLYPINPKEFQQNLVYIPSIIFMVPPHDTDPDHFDITSKIDEYRVRVKNANGATPDFAVGFVDGAVGLEPPGSATVTAGFGHPNAHQSVVVKDTAGGQTLAHEIGHNSPFYFGDTYIKGNLSSNNPRPQGPGESIPSGIVIKEEFMAASPTGALKLGSRRAAFPSIFQFTTTAGTTNITDFMGNERRRWVDPVTYTSVFNQLDEVEARGNSPLEVIENPIKIVGTIFSDSPSTITTVIEATTPINRTSTSFSSPYRVELQDDTGSILDSQSIPNSFSTERLGENIQTGEPFGEYVPISKQGFSVIMDGSTSASAVVLFENSTELARIDRSLTSPTVSISSRIDFIELPEGDVNIQWQASDVDGGESLLVDILYTPDNGNKELPLLIKESNDGEATIPAVVLKDLPGSLNGRFVIRATDGWNTADVMSSSFTVPDKNPIVAIVSPEDGGSYLVNDVVGLNSLAYDPEDLVIPDGEFIWSVEGNEIGDGPYDFASFAESGPITIRCTVRDSQGNEGFDEVTINLDSVPPASTQEVIDWILARPTPEVDADINGDSLIDASDIVSSENVERMFMPIAATAHHGHDH